MCYHTAKQLRSCWVGNITQERVAAQWTERKRRSVMNQNIEIVIAITVCIAIFAAIAVFLIKKILPLMKGRPRAKLAKLEMDPDKWYQLRYTVEDRRAHRVFLTYRLHSSRTGGNVSQGISNLAGMAIAYECHIDGTKMINEIVGKGAEIPGQIDRMERLDYFSHVSFVGADYTKQATTPICGIMPRPAGTEILIKAKVSLNQFTDSSLLILFVSH